MGWTEFLKACVEVLKVIALFCFNVFSFMMIGSVVIEVVNEHRNGGKAKMTNEEKELLRKE